MRLHSNLIGLFLAGILLANPAKVLAGDYFSGPMNPENSAVNEALVTDQWAQQENPIGPFQVVAVDYCYRGSIMDPTTGEMVDLFVMCADDEIGHGLDIA
jgi:hypothetical protein